MKNLQLLDYVPTDFAKSRIDIVESGIILTHEGKEKPDDNTLCIVAHHKLPTVPQKKRLLLQIGNRWTVGPETGRRFPRDWFGVKLDNATAETVRCYCQVLYKARKVAETGIGQYVNDKGMSLEVLLSRSFPNWGITRAMVQEYADRCKSQFKKTQAKRIVDEVLSQEW